MRTMLALDLREGSIQRLDVVRRLVNKVLDMAADFVCVLDLQKDTARTEIERKQAATDLNL